MKNCPNCASKQEDKAKFCNACGAPFPAEAVASTSTTSGQSFFAGATYTTPVVPVSDQHDYRLRLSDQPQGDREAARVNYNAPAYRPEHPAIVEQLGFNVAYYVLEIVMVEKRSEDPTNVSARFDVLRAWRLEVVDGEYVFAKPEEPVEPPFKSFTRSAFEGTRISN